MVRSWYRTSSGTGIVTEPTFIIPANTTIAPGAFLVLQETGTAGAPGTIGACSMRTGFNYNWASGYGVQIAVLNPSGTGVDYVHRNPFGGAVSPNLPPGTTWTGTLATTGDGVGRSGDVDTDSAADWAVGNPSSACAYNPGQNLPPPPVDLIITTPGAGAVAVSLVTTPPRPGAEFYILYSLQNFTPDGSGPFFGVGFDVIPQLAFPIIPGTPFHANLDGAGRLDVAYGPGTLPVGFFTEAVAIVIVGANVIGPSPVVQVSL
jgi:hypothetical protein